MHNELQLAACVHYSFLPEQYEDVRHEVTTRLAPKAVLGGDFCSFIPMGEQRFAACIFDAVGHGVASVLYAVRINIFALMNSLQKHDPCHLINALNEFLCSRLTESGVYASFFVACLIRVLWKCGLLEPDIREMATGGLYAEIEP